VTMSPQRVCPISCSSLSWRPVGVTTPHVPFWFSFISPLAMTESSGLVAHSVMTQMPDPARPAADGSPAQPAPVPGPPSESGGASVAREPLAHVATGESTRSTPELPSGTVTFLFTRVEGSTQLWEQHRDSMRAALARHHRIIEDLVQKHAGELVRPRGEGDSRFAVFTTAEQASVAAVEIQQALQAEAWPLPTSLRVRVARQTGEADIRDGDYYGTPPNRCANAPRRRGAQGRHHTDDQDRAPGRGISHEV
jgi:hypothetical protein